MHNLVVMAGQLCYSHTLMRVKCTLSRRQRGLEGVSVMYCDISQTRRSHWLHPFVGDQAPWWCYILYLNTEVCFFFCMSFLLTIIVIFKWEYSMKNVCLSSSKDHHKTTLKGGLYDFCDVFHVFWSHTVFLCKMDSTFTLLYSQKMFPFILQCSDQIWCHWSLVIKILEKTFVVIDIQLT